MIACQYTMGKKPMGEKVFVNIAFSKILKNKLKKGLVGSFEIDGLFA